MKNIVLFPTIGLPIPAIKGGAIETLITTLIDQNEKEKKYKFIVISSNDSEAIKLQQNYKYTEFINVKSKPMDKFFLFLYKVCKRLTNSKIAPLWLNRENSRAFKQIKNREIDFCICEGGFYRDFYTISKHFGVKKMILHLHAEFAPDYYIERTFKKYIAISEFILKQWERRLNDKNVQIKILYNCIDQKRFLGNQNEIDVREKYGLHNKYVIAYIGRIIPEKGVLQLINAFSIANIKDSVLLIIGSYNFGKKMTSDYCEYVIKKSKNCKNVICTGYVNNDMLSAYLKGSNLVVMPSLVQEAAGLVAIESLLMGKKLLVTNSGGVIEYAPEKYSYHIEKDQYLDMREDSHISTELIMNTDWKSFEMELAKKIREIFENNCETKESASRFVRKFDEKEYLESFHTIIKEFIDE